MSDLSDIRERDASCNDVMVAIYHSFADRRPIAGW